MWALSSSTSENALIHTHKTIYQSDQHSLECETMGANVDRMWMGL